MSYLTDDEKSLLFSALRREKEFCSRRLTDSKRCVSIMQNLEKKFYYDRFEKEIRDKAIEEFAEKVKDLIVEHTYPYFDKEGKSVSIWNADGYKQIDNLVKEIAEQMKEVGE